MRAQPYLLMEPLTEICISAAGDPFCVQCIMQSIEDMHTHTYTRMNALITVTEFRHLAKHTADALLIGTIFSISKMHYNIGIKYYMRV